MNKFSIHKEPQHENKYYVFVSITIYRAMHGKFPDFLSWCETSRNAREGYPTKFGYLTEHVMLEKEEAEQIANNLNEKYSTQIQECENSGNWENSPFNFNEMDLLWSR